ncbi:uncharacterized protein LOC136091964 [Hydra vulgaris]|uniref:Uncharacterized protein LOC136091964 n=1 Tax=Hydra vulgaris TaxID=6087 RepID=A0ABM4DMH1_HYDVU
MIAKVDCECEKVASKKWFINNADSFVSAFRNENLTEKEDSTEINPCQMRAFMNPSNRDINKVLSSSPLSNQDLNKTEVFQILSDIGKALVEDCFKKPNFKIPEHENSPEHRKCYAIWKEIEQNLKKGQTLENDLQRTINREANKCKDILKISVDAILFCANNNLGLRGSNDAIEEQKSGIFLSTPELISYYNPLLADHIATIKAAVLHFSPQIQNEIITIVGEKVKGEILSGIINAKIKNGMCSIE